MPQRVMGPFRDDGGAPWIVIGLGTTLHQMSELLAE